MADVKFSELSTLAAAAAADVIAIVDTSESASKQLSIDNVGTSTAIATTLAAGAVGQFKFVTCVTASDTVITPAATGGTYLTATLTTIGETLALLYHTTTVSGWYIMGGGSGIGASAATGVGGGPLTTS